MAQRSLSVQTNFYSGELAAEMGARVELERYRNGAKTMMNWLPMLHGGARTAPSSMFLATITGTARIEPWDAGTQYLLVFQNLSLKIINPSTGATVQTIVTPWGTSILDELDYSQALDTMVIVHGTTAPRRLFLSSGTFTLEDLSNTGNSIHLENIPLADKTYRWFPRVTTRVGDLVLPTINNDNGKYYRAKTVTQDQQTGTSEPSWPTTPVGATVTSNNVTFELVGAVSDVQVWSASKGWPQTVTFFGDRLVFGGNTTYPARLWFSKLSDYFNFDFGQALDDEGFDFEMASDEYESIKWLHSGRSLLIGTDKGEWAALQDRAISATSAEIKKQSAVGSKKVRPVTLDGAVLHVTRDGGQLREILYDDTQKGWGTASATVLNPRAVTNASQLAARTGGGQDHAMRVFIVNEDGMMGVLSRMREQEITALCRRTCTGTFESVCSLGGEVYAVISHAQGRALVRFDDDETTLGDALKTVTLGAPGTAFTGFAHLNGFATGSLAAVLDTWAITGTTVSAGTATTTGAGTTLTLGLKIPTPTLEPMPVNTDGVRGNIAHMFKRIIRALIQVRDTSELTMNGNAISFVSTTDDLAATRNTFSGVKVARGPLGWTREATVTITAETPYLTKVESLTREVAY